MVCFLTVVFSYCGVCSLFCSLFTHIKRLPKTRKSASEFEAVILGRPPEKVCKVDAKKNTFILWIVFEQNEKGKGITKWFSNGSWLMVAFSHQNMAKSRAILMDMFSGKRAQRKKCNHIWPSPDWGLLLHTQLLLIFHTISYNRFVKTCPIFHVLEEQRLYDWVVI